LFFNVKNSFSTLPTLSRGKQKRLKTQGGIAKGLGTEGKYTNSVKKNPNVCKTKNVLNKAWLGKALRLRSVYSAPAQTLATLTFRDESSNFIGDKDYNGRQDKAHP